MLAVIGKQGPENCKETAFTPHTLYMLHQVGVVIIISNIIMSTLSIHRCGAISLIVRSHTIKWYVTYDRCTAATAISKPIMAH